MCLSNHVTNIANIYIVALSGVALLSMAATSFTGSARRQPNLRCGYLETREAAKEPKEKVEDKTAL